MKYLKGLAAIGIVAIPVSVWVLDSPTKPPSVMDYGCMADAECRESAVKACGAGLACLDQYPGAELTLLRHGWHQCDDPQHVGYNEGWYHPDLPGMEYSLEDAWTLEFGAPPSIGDLR